MTPLIYRLPFLRPPEHQPLHTAYDKAAKSWQAGIDKLGFDAAYRHLLAGLPRDSQPRAAKMLDAGCGTGALASAFTSTTRHCGTLHLMDISRAMLDEAQRHLPHARTIQAAVGDAQTPCAPYDVVLCAHVIEHCPNPQAALVWLHQQLRPGGTLILSVSRPHWCTALVRWRWGHASFAPHLMAQMLRDAGFRQVTQRRYRTGPPSRLSCGYIARA